jgi:hypothetical protein
MSRNLKIADRRREADVRSKEVISTDRLAGQIVLTAFESRGGSLGRPVLAVLIASTLATIVIFAAFSIGYS